MIGSVFGVLFLGSLFSSSPYGFEEIKSHSPIGRIYYVHDEDAPRSYGELIYPIGEANMAGDEGIAHYIEHLVAWNSLPDEAKDAGRDFNASTTKIYTNYYMDSKELEDIFDYLSTTAQPIDLSEQYMVEEAGIVKNEFLLRDSEDPYVSLIDEFDDALYGRTGLGRSVMGKPEQIVEFDPQNALRIHDEFYDLSEAVLLVMSPLSKGQVKKAIEDAFSQAPQKTAQEAPLPVSEPISEPISERVYDGEIDQKTIMDEQIHHVIYNAVIQSPLPEKQDYQQNKIYLAFANAVLNSKKQGMFIRELEYDEKTFSSVQGAISIAPYGDGLDINLNGVSNKGTQPEYLGDSFLNWLAEIDEHREIVHEIVEKSKENFQRDWENWTADDEYYFLQYQFYDDFSQSPMRAKDFFRGAQDVSADEVVEFMKNLSANYRVVDRIWEGKEK